MGFYSSKNSSNSSFHPLRGIFANLFLGRSSAISSSYNAKIFLHFFSSAKTAEVTCLLPAALFSVDICTTDVNCIDIRDFKFQRRDGDKNVA